MGVVKRCQRCRRPPPSCRSHPCAWSKAFKGVDGRPQAVGVTHGRGQVVKGVNVRSKLGTYKYNL